MPRVVHYVKFYKEKYDKDVDNIAEVLNLLTTLDIPDIQELFSECERAGGFFLNYKNKKKGLSRFVDNTINSIDNFLKFYKVDSIIELTKETTFNVDDIRRVPHAIYITGSVQGRKEDAAIIAPIISFLINKSVELSPRKNKLNTLPVHMFLDEFANMGKMLNVSNIFSQARKEEISIFTAFQDWGMLEKYYNKNEISTIEGNTAHKLFLLNNRNQSTVDKINALAGEEEVWYTYENYAYDEDGNRYLVGIRRELSTQKVINPKKVRELKKGEGILFCASQPVIDDIKINPWFETERFSKYLDNTFDTEVDDSLNDLIDFNKPNFTSIIATDSSARINSAGS